MLIAEWNRNRNDPLARLRYRVYLRVREFAARPLMDLPPLPSVL